MTRADGSSPSSRPGWCTWHDPHLAALRTVFTRRGDWSADLEVESALDGDVANTGVARYRDLDSRHLTRMHTGTARTGHGLAALPHDHLRHPHRTRRPHPRHDEPCGVTLPGGRRAHRASTG